MKNAMRLSLVSVFMGTDFWSGFLLQLVYGGQQKKWICMMSDAGLGLYLTADHIISLAGTG